MNIIYILAPLSLALAAVFVFVFFRAVDGGQFEDLDTPAHRALYDSPSPDFEKGNQNDPR